MTVEHLSSQNPTAADGQAPDNVGAIGNLILVPSALNKTLGNKSFDKKKLDLKKAKVPLDPSIESTTTWGKAEIIARTKALAKLAYEKVFRV